jgi:hypothetical protein
MNMRNKRPAGIFLNILIFVVLITTTILILRPLQKELLIKMTELRDELIVRGESFLGMKIEYDSMGPSLFSTLDIRGIRIYGSSPEPVASLTRIRLSFSLPGLLQGQGAEAFRSVTLNKPLVSLDSANAGDWETLFAQFREKGEETGGESSADWLSRLPGKITVKIRGGECKLLIDENSFSLDGIRLDTIIRGDLITVRGKLRGNAFLGDFLGQPMSAGINSRFNGELDTRLREGRLALIVPSFSGDRFNLRAVQFDISLDAEKIEAQKAGDRFPFDLSAGYMFDKRSFFGRFEGRGFTPGHFLSLSGPWGRYDPFLGMSLTGTAAFETGGPNGVSYNLDLSGDPGTVFPVPGISYAVSASGNGPFINFRELFLGFPQGDIRYAGDFNFETLSPNGRILINDFSLARGDDISGEDRINGDLTILSFGRTITVFGDGVSLGPVFFTTLDADILREDSGLSFALSALRFTGTDSAYEDVRMSRLSMDGSLDYEPLHLQASLILDIFPMDEIIQMLKPLAITPVLPEPVLNIAGDTSITTEVFVTTDFKQILYNSPRFVVAYQGQQKINAVASISGTDRHFELNDCRIVFSGNEALISGYLDFNNPGEILFSLISSYRDTSYYLEGTIIDDSISLQGSYGLSAYITQTSRGGYSGYIEAESIPVPLGKQFFRLRFLLSLRYDSPESWMVDPFRVEISELVTPASQTTTVQLSGRADQDGIVFPDITFNDGIGSLAGRASLSWSGGSGEEPVIAIPGFQNGEQTPRVRPAWSQIRLSLHLEGREDRELYTLEGTYENGTIDARLFGWEMRLGRISDITRNASATGEGRLHWTIGGPYELTVDLASLSARYYENTVNLSAQGSVTETELAIRNLRADYGNFEVNIPSFRLNRELSTVRAQAQIRGIAVGRRLDSSLGFEADFEPIGSWFALQTALDSFSGVLHVEQARLDTLELPEPFRLNFSRNESLVSLFGGPQDMLRFRITNDGSFYAGFSYPSPIRGSIAGTLTSRTIDAHASNLYVDLVSLGRLLPHKEIVTLAGGFANVSVEIRGPLGDPEFFGTAWGNSVRLEIPQYLDAELGPVPVLVTLDGNEMRFGPINVPAGKGAGMVSGWFRFDRWVPNTFSIDIHAPQETPVPFNFEIMGIRSGGGASGYLNVSMEDLRLHLTGDLLGEDTEIILDNQGIISAMDQPRMDNTGVVVDISLTTGRKVEFFWPTADYPLLQAVASAGSEMKITSDTETSRFSIVGDINLRSGSLYYGQRNFYIREGTLFFNENEIQFEPRISIRAETRDRNNDGPVIISLLVDNGPLKSFTARFEANPPLSQIEILSLLGQNLTGLPAEGEEGGGVQNIVFSGVDFLSQSIVFRRLERMIRNFTGLDMFTFHSPIVQNFMASQWTPVDNRDRRGNYFDNTAVFFGKYFSSDMFLLGSVLLQYDENKLDMGGYTLDADLGIELRSPLFDIRWSIAPFKYESFFDSSFTLTWRWLL